MDKSLKILIILSSVILSSDLFAQSVYEPISNKGIYEFLDNMAQKGLITFKDNIRPVTRKYIAEKLLELRNIIKSGTKRSENITEIDKDEIYFYLKDYGLEESFIVDKRQIEDRDSSLHKSIINDLNKTESLGSSLTFLGFDRFNRWRLFSYSNELFKLIVDPILGFTYSVNDSKTNRHVWNGISSFGYLQNNIGFSFYFRDNNENGDGIDKSKMFTPETGIVIAKGSENSIQYSEVHTNLSVDWSWGVFNIGKDFLNWGYGQSGLLVLSNKAPSFPFIRLDINPAEWLSFNYIHGWLNSYILDSSRIYPTKIAEWSHGEYRDKFFASHTLSITALKGLNFSIGESIIYSDRLEFVYLMPLMFFHFADHYLSKANNNVGQNSQIFFGISSRNHIKNTHLYGSLFIDEITISGLFDNQKRKNQFGFTIGASVTDLPFVNLTFTTEYTRINPYVYDHYIPTITYSSSDYSLGHWMGNNADLIFGSLKYAFKRGLQAKVWVQYIRKGESGDTKGQYELPQPPFLFGPRKNYTDFGLEIQYELINELFIKSIFSSSSISDEQKDGSYVQNRQNKFSLSLYYGL